MDPKQERPRVDAGQPPSISGSFRLNLVSNGSVIGQLGVNDDQYCVIVPPPQGTILSMYYYKGSPYIRPANNSWLYLSVSDDDKASLNHWAGAWSVDFTHEGWLNCSYNHQNLSFDSVNRTNSHLYFRNRNSVLTVVPIAA